MGYQYSFVNVVQFHFVIQQYCIRASWELCSVYIVKWLAGCSTALNKVYGLAKLDNIVGEHVNHNVGRMLVDFSRCS